MPTPKTKPLIAIACGGTGGHLFPGLAVAGTLADRGCEVLLMISPKDIDQQAVTAATDTQVVVLPAVAWNRGQFGTFARGFIKSFRAAGAIFRTQRPRAVLAMGGFTSAPPVLAAKLRRASTFLHESNTIPGRANRWLARVVDQAFVGFSETAPRLRHRHVVPTGTPVRPQFQPVEPQASRCALGLDPLRPVLLIQGGSQGAHAINVLATETLPRLIQQAPQLQFLHLTGETDVAEVKAAYARHQGKAIVLPFLTEMELALGAATLAVSRAGASSLAELAAMRVPSILIPYPAAMDNHQFFNASVFARTGAAMVLEEKQADPDSLAELVLPWVTDPSASEKARRALAGWDCPYAAELIADKILAVIPEHDAKGSRVQTVFPVPVMEREELQWKGGGRVEFRSLPQ